ncbi:hypothetical protein ACFL4Q_04005 [candidate division KSB1 bacterium]
MAEFLSQQEIDAMLSHVNDSDEITTEEPKKDGNDARADYMIESSKVYKNHEKPVRKYIYNYNSPVIKKENIVYYPGPQISAPPEKQVVFTLEQFRKNR